MHKHGVFLSTAAAVAVLAAPGVANAGWYGALEAGVNWNELTSVSTDDIDPVWGPGTYIPTFATFDMGWAVLGTVGHDFGLIRWDILEGGYRSNNLKDFNVLGGANLGGGNFDELSLMSNINLDWDISSHWTLSAGGGAGADFIINYDNNAGFHTPPTLHDDDVAFAWQLIAGVTFHSSPFDYFVNYRYMTVTSPTFTEYDGGGLLHDDSYSNVHEHTVTFGVRFYADFRPGTTRRGAAPRAAFVLGAAPSPGNC